MKRLTVLILGVLLSTLAVADECAIDLKYDIRVSSESLTVYNGTETVYTIRQGGLVSVKGESIDLDEGQQALAEEYAGEVAVLVPQWIELVSSALKVAEESLQVAFTAAFGEGSAAVSKSTEAVASARERFERSSSANTEEGIYSISVFTFNDLEGAFDEEFSEDLEDAIMASLGSVFVEIGKTLMSSEGAFEDRMEAFGERMDLMGRELDSMGEGLKDTVRELCDGVKSVQELEKQLSKEIPELADYPLFGS